MSCSSEAAIQARARSIAERLRAYKDRLRETHIEGLELSMDLHRLQDLAELNPAFGHRIFAKFDDAQLKVSGALASATEGHVLARHLAPRAGINPTNFGEKTPDDDEDARRGRGTSDLRAVA